MKEIVAYKCNNCGKKYFENIKCECYTSVEERYSSRVLEISKWYIKLVDKFNRHRIRIYRWEKKKVVVEFYNLSEGFESDGFKAFTYHDLDLPDYEIKKILTNKYLNDKIRKERKYISNLDKYKKNSIDVINALKERMVK